MKKKLLLIIIILILISVIVIYLMIKKKDNYVVEDFPSILEYSDTTFNDILQVNNGYIIVGTSQKENQENTGVIIKLDQNLKEIWKTKTNKLITEIIPTDLGYLVYGENYYYKINYDGLILSSHIEDDYHINSATNTSDNGIIFGGWSNKGGVIKKYDNNYNLEFTKYFEGFIGTKIISVIELENGEILALVNTENCDYWNDINNYSCIFSTFSESYLLHYNTSGEFVSKTKLKLSGEDMELTPAGELVVVGFTETKDDFRINYYGTIIKLDPVSKELFWTRNYGNKHYEDTFKFNSISINNKEIIVSGYCDKFVKYKGENWRMDSFIVKYNFRGEIKSEISKFASENKSVININESEQLVIGQYINSTTSYLGKIDDNTVTMPFIRFNLWRDIEYIVKGFIYVFLFAVVYDVLYEYENYKIRKKYR